MTDYERQTVKMPESVGGEEAMTQRRRSQTHQTSTPRGVDVNTAKEEEKRGLFVLFDPPVRAIPQLAIVDNIVIIFFFLFPFLLFPLFFNHMEVSLESLDD